MRHFSTLLLRPVLAASITAGAVAVSTGAANAAPAMAPLGSSVARQFEKAYWTSQCWWVQTDWGPQRQCRQVWVGVAPVFPHPLPLPHPLPFPPHPFFW